MDRIKNKYLGAIKFSTIPLKTLGVIAVGMFFIMGLYACGANKAMSGHAKSKALAENLYPDKKPSVAHVQSSSANSAKPAVQQLGLNSIKRMQPSGEYSIYVLKNSEWQKAGTLKCDRFLREQSLDLSPFLSAKEPIKIRLLEKGGVAAHIDVVLLGGIPPAKIKGGQDAGSLKKISKRDFDVMDAFEKRLELTFPATEKDKTLYLTARVEPETISKTPFQFPTKNLFREINENARFYTYKLGSQKSGSTPNAGSEAKQQPFFKEYCSTGSGHPSGFTYGWVRNDDENLYVKIDFTPDNTMDGDKDYARLYVKTDEGLKTFTVSEPDTKWGKADFTSTDKAAYEHKVYNIQIPLKELNVKNADKGKELLLAFSAYGTAYPKSYVPVTAYNPVDDHYLVVYEEYPSSGLSQIWAQVIDADGNIINTGEQIFHEVQYNSNIALAYDSVNDGFLAVWEHYPGVGGYSEIYGMWITVDGAGNISAGTQFVVNCDTESLTPYNVSANQWNPAVAFDSANQNFLVVWVDGRNSGTPNGTDIYGQIVQSCPAGPPCNPLRCNKIDPTELDKLISHGDPPYYQIGDQWNPAIAYDSVKGEYLVVWEYYYDHDNHDGGDPETYLTYPSIFGQFVDDTGDHIYGENFPVSVDWWDDFPIIYAHEQYNPSIGYDSYNKKFLITWEDDRNNATTGIDIYSQRVTTNTSPFWWSGHKQIGGGDGVTILGLRDDFVISNAADDQLHPALTYDSTYNSFLVVWEDYRNGASTGYDIYGQPVYANDDISYPALGQSVEVYILGDNQTHPSIAYNPNDQKFLSAFETDPDTANDIAFTIISLEDGDNDGMPYWWETFYGLDPYADDSAEDPDGDGMTNLQEYLNDPSTNPNENDNDKDGDGVWENGSDNCPSFRNKMQPYALGKSKSECADSILGIAVGDLWQPDYDCDGIGNECDDDGDDDGYPDSDEAKGSDCDDLDENIYPGDGVCPDTGIGDAPGGTPGKPQDDGDGVDEAVDNCPGEPNPKVQYNTGDSIGDCAITEGLVDADGNWQPDYDCDGYGDDCDTCRNFANGDDQTIPVWYKDEDDDGYSNGETLSTETQPECNRPAGYKLEGELTNLAEDCADSPDDLPPHDPPFDPSLIHPDGDEVKGNGIDDDCDPTTSDNLGDYTIAIKSMSPVYNSWKPVPGDTLTIEFMVDGPNGEVPNAAGDVLTSDFQFSLAEPSPYLPSGQGNPTNYSGQYHNDPTEAGGTPPDDFTYNLPQTGNPLQLTCNDYGAWIEVHVEVSLERGNGTPLYLAFDFTFPRDRDRDGIGDFFEDQYGGDLNPNDDLENDGKEVIDEYRGYMWGKTTRVEPGVPPYYYDTPAYVPEGGPQGTVSHFRGKPTERDLFIKFNDGAEGFNDQWPFAIGAAFYNLSNYEPEKRVAVHALGETKVATLPTQSDTYNIDVVTVTLKDGTYNPIPTDPQHAQSSHIVKRSKRDWTFLVVANGSYGDDQVYGNAKLYKPTIENFMGGDKPYHDYTTLKTGGNRKKRLDWVCNGTYEPDEYNCIGGTESGELERVELCEDANDNGEIDGGENRSGNDRLDGDVPVLNESINPAYNDGVVTYAGDDIDGDGHVDEFDYRFELSPFNFDKDDEVELPIAGSVGEIVPLYENTRAQAIKMLITHEVGHCTGVRFHTGDETDTMFEETKNLVRDNRFGPDSENVIRIH